MQGIALLIPMHAGLQIASRTLQKNALCSVDWKITDSVQLTQAFCMYIIMYLQLAFSLYTE